VQSMHARGGHLLSAEDGVGLGPGPRRRPAGGLRAGPVIMRGVCIVGVRLRGGLVRGRSDKGLRLGQRAGAEQARQTQEGPPP
jgi:hypothetical protein